MTPKETLLNKSINSLVDYCQLLEERNEKLKNEVKELKAVAPSEEVKTTNKTLREENKKLKSQLEKFTKLVEALK
jgi:regulator of replication initiation timing